jgi:hypothetical protein
MGRRTYMYLREKLKQVLNLGFAAGDQGVIGTVENQKQALEKIKVALGLPQDATLDQVQQMVLTLTPKTKLPMEERPELPQEEEITLVSEMRKMDYEPLLPVEKKLITWSIILGLVLLVLFVWVSYTYFPGTH